MIWALLCIAIICAALLFAQRQEHRHQRVLRCDVEMLASLRERIDVLEAAKLVQFDSAAFEDLKTKVEAFRMAQGLRGR